MYESSDPVLTELYNQIQRSIDFFIKEREINISSDDVGIVLALSAGTSFALNPNQMMEIMIGKIVMDAQRGFMMTRDKLNKNDNT